MSYKDKVQQREATKERVRRYRDKLKGVTSSEGVTGTINLHSGPVLHLDNGSYIHVIKLVDPKSRELLTYLSEHAKIGDDNLRVGVQGPTIKECRELLEVTA